MFQSSLVAAPMNPAQAQFANTGHPLDLEIGCGVGWHSIQYATENPNRNLIAIEHTRAKFNKFEARLKRHKGLTNLRAVHADAIRWITHFVGDQSVDRCFILYPNPEPKAHNKRWLRMPFMHRLLATLKPGAELTLATNKLSYRNEAREWAEKAWSLELVEAREFSNKQLPNGLPRTHFERKYLLNGETCYDLRWRKY